MRCRGSVIATLKRCMRWQTIFSSASTKSDFVTQASCLIWSSRLPACFFFSKQDACSDRTAKDGCVTSCRITTEHTIVLFRNSGILPDPVQQASRVPILSKQDACTDKNSQDGCVTTVALRSACCALFVTQASCLMWSSRLPACSFFQQAGRFPIRQDRKQPNKVARAFWMQVRALTLRSD